jgi:hypothetical protein
LTNDLVTVENVLAASCEFDHELPVRSIGPALCLVLERDAPLRMETLASTEAEFRALEESCRNDLRWKALLDTYFALKDEEEGQLPREDAHAERLQAGQRLSSVRVTDRACLTPVPE